MAKSNSDLTLEFADEILVAQINPVVYRKIYALEGWPQTNELAIPAGQPEAV